MGSIVTDIIVDVEGAGALDALAASADAAATAIDKLEASLGKGLDASTGADKMAASYDAALKGIQDQLDKLQASFADLGKGASAGADAGAASLSKLDDSLKAASEQADTLATSAGRADDALKGIGTSADGGAAGLGRMSDAQKAVAEQNAAIRDTSAGAAEGIKGTGAVADASAVQMAEFNKVMADSAAVQARTAGVSADASLAMARSSRVQADAKTALATSSVEQDAAMAQSAKATQAAHEDAAASAEAGAKKHEMLALAVGAAAAYGIDKAAQLQASVTRLYTSAGESKANLPMISSGILKMAPQTATSQSQLAQGAYYVESAGFHGKSALQVLKSVAEGAYAEGAPLADVANAETSILNAYGIKPGKSMSVMNQMLTAVGQGKMTMAGLSSALPAVLPTAAAAGISLPQVLGSMSSMTAMGTSPDEAAQEMRHTITALQKPSGVQSAEMQMLGINPVKLAHDLGKEGLTGTIAEVDTAIKKHIGSGGLVMIDTMNQSKLAVASAHEEIAKMPAAIQGTAQAYLDGSISAKAFNQAVRQGGESARDANLLKQFESTAGTALGFSSLVKSGLGNQQTVAAALNALMGGQVGQQVALMLGGGHLPTTTTDVSKVQQAAGTAGPDVQGWHQVQSTLKFQLGSADQALQSVATEIGKTFLPVATAGMKDIASVGKFFAGHEGLVKDLAEIGGGFGALLGVKAAGSKAAGAADSLAKLFGFSGIGKSSGLDAAAGNLSVAAGRLSLAAEKLGGTPGVAIPGGPAGTTSEATAAADAEKAAPAALSLGTLIPAVQRAALPAAALAAADMLAKDYGQQAARDVHAPQLHKGSVLGNVAATVAQETAGLIPELGPAVNAVAGFFGASTSGGKADRLPGWGGGSPNYTGRAASLDPFGAYRPPPPPAESPDMLAAGGHPGTAGIAPPGTTGAESRDVLSWAGHAGTATAKIGVTVDTSSISAAKGKIAADLAALSTSQGMKPAKVPAPDLSALTSAKGPATAAGASVGTGFAGGIAAGAGAVSAAAHSLAAAAVAALTMHLQSSSPSKVTHAIGQDGFDAGFAGGITDGQGAAIAATAALGTSSVSTLVQSLEGGSTSLQNALTALYGPLADSQAVTTIAQEIATLQASHPADSKWLGKQGAKLEQLANQAGALEQQISGAQQVATSVIGGASVMSASGYTAAVPTAGGPQSAQSILSGTALQVSDTKQFAKELAQAQKEGLNATTLSEIAQAGVTAGLPVLQGLLQGGPGTVKQMNALESQLIKAGGQIGNVGGPAGYQATLAADAAAGAQLKSELSMVGKEMSKVANEVSKATGGTKSTSATSAGTTSTGAAAASVTALASGGKSAAGSLDAVNGAAHGAAGGLNSVDSAAHAAASALAALAGAAGGSSSGSGSGSGASAGTGTGLMPRTGGGGGGAQAQGGGFTPGFHGISGYGQAPVIHQTTHVHLNVQGSVMSDQDLASHVQRVLLNHGSNNWQAGMNYPGRSN